MEEYKIYSKDENLILIIKSLMNEKVDFEFKHGIMSDNYIVFKSYNSEAGMREIINEIIDNSDFTIK
ncbi:MAG: hypothetical protein IAA73_07465 [Bacteroidetes bacterium]|uniref:DUF4911 domain-containing protein n=1 Tax=Candidatus Gallipaludibacter merdavium TaxID=2840839 RepID=A0A9D9HUM1_9BACT|nr:hypothetical protein [Candidatus Gallipaludibacter merdavium]